MTGKLKTLLLAAAAGAMMTMTAGAMAQAPGGGPGAGGPPRGPGMGGPGMGGQLDRAGAIQQFGLGDAALNLTAAQKAELDKAADAYVTAMTAVNAKFPRTQGTPPSPEATAARAKPREDMNAAVAKVLTAEQKKTWDAAQAARPRGGPGGGMGGPGGGMGGPPGGGPGGPPGGARPPGQ
jgi:translation initiation factor IF-2